MKHEISSYNTKKALSESLKKAMRQKPFSKITISELISDCGVNRKTFYYHFPDIYALLKWMFEEEAIEVVRHFNLLENYEDAIRFIMKYIDENDHLISCAYDSIGRDELKRFFYADFMDIVTSVIKAAEEKQHTRLDPEIREYAAKFYTEALAGMLIDWARNRDRDCEKTINYLVRIVEAALTGINPRKSTKGK